MHNSHSINPICHRHAEQKAWKAASGVAFQGALVTRKFALVGVVCLIFWTSGPAQMSGIMEYNGSAIVAMGGANCVGIACDRRLGSQSLQTVANNFQKVHAVNKSTLVGLAGLATDVQTLNAHLRYRMNLYSLKEEREMEPRVVSNLLGTMLYGRRFAPWFVSPVVAGLTEKNEPFLSTFDFVGAACHTKDFVVAGSSSEQLYGVCESLWRENMNPEELFETLSQCLLAGVDRDCLAGWGGYVYILTADKLITRSLKTRMD